MCIFRNRNFETAGPWFARNVRNFGVRSNILWHVSLCPSRLIVIQRALAITRQTGTCHMLRLHLFRSVRIKNNLVFLFIKACSLVRCVGRTRCKRARALCTRGRSTRLHSQSFATRPPLFISNGKPLDGATLRYTFMRNIHLILGKRVTFNQSRHSVIAFTRQLITNNEQGTFYIDMQAGHSEQTAALEYARSDCDLSYLDPMAAHGFYLSSKGWQDLICKYTYYVIRCKPVLTL